jgi:nucleosome binding factor SPN SPT16 subunit
MYTSKQRVGILSKETYSGKLIADWERLIGEVERKPEVVDMSPSVSSFMAVKDADELV